jgi:hypothetical protein
MRDCILSEALGLVEFDYEAIELWCYYLEIVEENTDLNHRYYLRFVGILVLFYLHLATYRKFRRSIVLQLLDLSCLASAS